MLKNARAIIENTRVKVAIVGPSGAGKNTLIKNLCKDDRYFLLSTGQLLRDEIKRQSEVGKRVEGLVKSQTPVDDNTIWELVTNTLRSEKASPKSFIIFEGFPRTVEQAKRLDTILVLQKAISVRAENNVIVQRLAKIGVSEQTATEQLNRWVKDFEPLINYWKSTNKLR